MSLKGLDHTSVPTTAANLPAACDVSPIWTLAGIARTADGNASISRAIHHYAACTASSLPEGIPCCRHTAEAGALSA
ncbi:hypothetical protein DVU_1380 [Nitratidesulfovibrio vulgaris str. Hildenborough]|uniref:Uncharacterized protein n=1 Tax=Nitratidesulfovibrio vulgaris (strain ATCC 29579 / DSM 644 / CCUG 34227 / NCIMB 8303 / VKM B-1760 / Hildenborough) TaxID=882 RepID=Q72CA4_NITV2|nr:hypothetical protein DVU_1380 [Nitratidesulfovibrio vulgaris str. Hildenborough]